jgi:hypothetical protein
MPEFNAGSTIHDVLRDCREGRDLLYKHGYDVGDGFVDVLSHYESLRDAAREGRLRDLRRLINELNSVCGTRGGRGVEQSAGQGLGDKPEQAGHTIPRAAAADRPESEAPRAARSGPDPGPDEDEPPRPVTAVGLFAADEEAERAIGRLMQDRFSSEQIGYLEPGDLRKAGNPAEGAVKGVVLGGVAGAIIGALLPAIAYGISSGFGALLEGGAIVPMLIGVVLGGSILGVVGGLFGAEAKSEDDLYFIEEAESGRVLVSVEVTERAAEKRAIELMRECHALEVDSLGTARFHARLRHPQLHAHGDTG